uniref:Glutathione synthetase n=1 Tax=Ditylenchus dipsaci TaxID=166011 RepID=A0A915EA57_9BILA
MESVCDAHAIVLVVIEDTNQNQLDQKFVEFELEKVSENKVNCLRLTFTQCTNRLSLDQDTYSLLVDGGKHKVPEWQARLTIERSTAIKCPWIGLQLANTKKIQQVLDGAGVVEHYFPRQPQMAADVRSTFADLWGLENDDEQTTNVIQDAISNPHKYVLKPQLEGGAGNYYDEQITQKLKTFSPQQRAAHILMQKISPLVVKNYLIRPFHKPVLVQAVSELGIYGCLLGNGEDMSISTNISHGHILRSKGEKVNEGGVAVGAAVIDTPFLI